MRKFMENSVKQIKYVLAPTVGFFFNSIRNTFFHCH